MTQRAMIHAPMFRNPYAEPGELQNFPPPKPLIRRRFGIWGCFTRSPFVYGCGYDIEGAYKEWERIYAEKMAEQPLPPATPIPIDPRVLCEAAAEERE